MMNAIQIEQQLAVCAKFKVEFCAISQDGKVGVSLNARSDILPLNGLRYKPVGDTTGWYIWRGEYSDASDFFVPLHFSHLEEWCPDVIPYLQLPPGWGFVLAPNYEDVWFDANRVLK